MSKIGLIQVRGLGDCVVILPMAEWFHRLGYDVYVALDDRFCESFQAAAPYCTFVPVPFSAFNPQHGIINEYWYELPYRLLEEKGCSPIISFPQHECFLLNEKNTSMNPVVRDRLLTRVARSFENKAWKSQCYKHLKFDEFKYAVAQVPFRIKWGLTVQRNEEREQALYNKLVDPRKKQLVCHLDGSNFSVDAKSIPYDPDTTQLINITPEATSNIFDWLLILEKAETLVLIDSVFFNLVEQLNFTNKKYFIRRSPRESTPVIGNDWEFLNINVPDHNTLYG